MLHQPFGLMTPETLLQAFDGSNRTQLLHFLLPFGVTRYETAEGGILPAIASSVPNVRAPATPVAQAKPCSNIERRETSTG